MQEIIDVVAAGKCTLQKGTHQRFLAQSTPRFAPCSAGWEMSIRSYYEFLCAR